MSARRRVLIAVVLTVSVGLRLAVALYLGDTVPPRTDDYSYSQLAARLAAGYGYTFDEAWYPFTPAGAPTAHWSFLYTAFLAAVYTLFGVHPLAARIVQAVLGGILLPWITYLLAQRVFGHSQPVDPSPAPHRPSPAQSSSRAGLPVASTVEPGDFAQGPASDEKIRRGPIQMPIPTPFQALSSVVRRLSSVVIRPSSSIALLATAIAALYAYFILYAARLLTETFYIVALLWSLERALAVAARPSVGRSAALGLALGLSTLLRQSILPWVPVLFAWLCWREIRTRWPALRAPVDPTAPSSDTVSGVSCLPSPSGNLGPSSSSILHRSSTVVRRSSFVAVSVTALILAASIVPWTLRNYRVYDHFLLLNSNAGYAMYSAQHPFHTTSFQEYTPAPLPDDLLAQDLNEAQWDRILLRRGVRFILDDPARYLLLSLSRVRDYFEFWPTADSSLLYNLGRVASFTLLLPFMIYGIVLAVRSRAAVLSLPTAHSSFVLRRSSCWPASSFFRSLVRVSTTPVALLLLFIGFYSFLHILTWAMTRYRLPVDAVAIPFAALAIDYLARCLATSRRHNRLVP